MPSPIQRNFSAGELSPAMYANADMVRYQQGLKVLRNAIVLRTGGVQSRAGTEYLGSSKGNAFARIIPCVFDDDQAYVLELGLEYIRFWLNGALVTVGTPAAWLTATAYTAGQSRAEGGTNYICLISHTSGTFATDLAAGRWYALTSNILELPSPWATEQELRELQFAIDVGFVRFAHNGYTRRTLTRLSATEWTIAEVTTTSSTLATPTSPSVTGTAGTTTEWKVTAVDIVSGAESLATTAVGNTQTLTDLASSPATFDWVNSPTATAYRVYRKDSTTAGIFGLLAQVSSEPYVDSGSVFLPADTSSQPPVPSTTFSTAADYPGVIGSYQQRILLSGTTGGPDVVNASQVGEPDDFTVSNPMQDSDAMSWRQVGRRVNRVRHFAEIAQRLVQFSSVGESIIQGDTDGILRPGEVNPRQFSENGAATYPAPLVINDSALYVQARGAIVRDIAPIEANGFAGSDVTLQAAHLVDGFNIVDWCYQQTPDSVVWAVRDDGTLLSLTYVRELGVLGWATHDTDGTFESVCCVPENGRDAVYAVVLRDIDGTDVRYVERFADRLADVPVLVDAGVTLTAGTPVNGIELLRAGLGTWTAQDTPTGIPYVSVIVGTDRAILVQEDVTAYSTDLETWVASSALANDLQNTFGIFGGGTFVLAGEDPDFLGRVAYTTTTGASWTQRTITMTAPQDVVAGCYSTTLGFLLLSADTLWGFISSDSGTSWVEGAVTGLSSIQGHPAWGDTPAKFVATNEIDIFYSANGLTWNTATLPSFDGTVAIRQPVWCDDRFACMYSDDSTQGLLISTDAQTWTKVDLTSQLPVGNGFTNLAWNGVDEILYTEDNSDAVIISGFTTATAVAATETVNAGIAYAAFKYRFVAAVDSPDVSAQTATYAPSSRVTGLTYLDGESLSAVSGTTVAASPNNPAYTAVVVADGVADFPEDSDYTSLTVGLPYTTDIQTLDIDTSGGTLKPGKFLITAVGAWTEETMSFYVGPEEPTTATGLTLPSGGSMQAMQVLDRNENAVTTPQTGFRTLNFEGRWSDSGSIFIRNIDPTPLTVLALVPYGTYPR